MKNIIKLIIVASGGILLSLSAQAGISHCYHWFNSEGTQRLQAKLDYAAKNNGELLLKDDPSAPQDGMYCTDQIWHGAMYGDRVIRIDFAEDVVISNEHGNLCGKNDNYFRPEECQKKEPDVKYLTKDLGWYYILPNRPAVIRSWSVNGEALMQELQKILTADNAVIAPNIQAALKAMKDEKSGKGAGAFTNAKGRLGLDEQIKDEGKWASLGLPRVLERAAVSKGLSEAEKTKIADKVFAKVVAAPQFKIDSKETTTLVSTSPMAKAAFARTLLKNEARWKEMGLSQVLDQVYFSGLTADPYHDSNVDKIVAQMYPGLQGAALLNAMKADMAKSKAVESLYSHRYFASEQNWADRNPMDVLKQASTDNHLGRLEQEAVYAKTFAKMFANPTPIYDRVQLAQLLQGPTMFAVFRQSFVAQTQQSLGKGANIQLILDGFILTRTPMSPQQAQALWTYLGTHAGLKTKRLLATFQELGYAIR